jgi:uncharacterized coiled-coil protein SlyX
VTEPPPPPDQTLPTWLKAAVLLGVPSVIALFLVYMLTIEMAARITAIEQMQALQTQTLTALGQAFTARVADADRQREHFAEGQARLERLIRAACVVAARTSEERARCLAP